MDATSASVQLTRGGPLAKGRAYGRASAGADSRAAMIGRAVGRKAAGIAIPTESMATGAGGQHPPRQVQLHGLSSLELAGAGAPCMCAGALWSATCTAEVAATIEECTRQVCTP